MNFDCKEWIADSFDENSSDCFTSFLNKSEKGKYIESDEISVPDENKSIASDLFEQFNIKAKDRSSGIRENFDKKDWKAENIVEDSCSSFSAFLVENGNCKHSNRDSDDLKFSNFSISLDNSFETRSLLLPAETTEKNIGFIFHESEYTLYTRATFSIPSSTLETLKEIKDIHRNKAIHHLRRVKPDCTKGNSTTTISLHDSLSEWHSATIYWIHPSTALPSSALALNNQAKTLKKKGIKVFCSSFDPHNPAEDEFTAYHITRRQDWQNSFQALYHSLYASRSKDEECRSSYFYTRSAQSTILWRYSDACSESIHDIDAVISQSTGAERRKLTECGISFTMPLSDSVGKNLKRKLDDAFLEKFEDEVLAGRCTRKENYAIPYKTMLYIKGQENVHGLYELLMQQWDPQSREFIMEGKVQDVPSLLSPNPFMCSTLRSLRIQSSGRVYRDNDNETSNSESDLACQIELAGPILPCAVRRLAKALKNVSNALADSLEYDEYSSSNTMYTLNLRSDEDTLYFNKVLGCCSGKRLLKVERNNCERDDIAYSFELADPTVR